MLGRVLVGGSGCVAGRLGMGVRWGWARVGEAGWRGAVRWMARGGAVEQRGEVRRAVGDGDGGTR